MREGTIVKTDKGYGSIEGFDDIKDYRVQFPDEHYTIEAFFSNEITPANWWGRLVYKLKLFPNKEIS